MVIGIIMTYNCADLLERTVRELPKGVFDQLIVVDDGSIDNVRSVARRLKLKFFGHEHGGYGANIKFGLKKALALGATVLVEIHGDGQYDPAFIRPAVAQIKKGADLVIADRFVDLWQPLRDGMSLMRFCGDLILTAEANLVFGLPHRELFSGAKAYSPKLCGILDYTHSINDYFYVFEIVAQAKLAGLKFGRVPTRGFYNRSHTSASLVYGAMHIYLVPYTLALYLLAKMGIKLGVFQSQ